VRLLLLLFFFLSGAGGLIYEVVWTKLLTLVIGSTVYSISTVLVAFMGGLALGSYIGGRIIDKRGDPLLVYGILEGLIGLYCLIIPTLINSTDPLFAVLYNRFYSGQFYFFSLLRFIVCAAILVIPTTLMGATLPVLSRFFVLNRERFGSYVGVLYAINTFGAVLGSFGSGFVLLPKYGQWKTILIAASVNLSICVLVVAYWLAIGRHRKWSGESPAETERPLPQEAIVSGKTIPPAMVLTVLLAYAANGFSGMAYQIAWTRALSLSLGSSTYSFSLILTAFILGLALGSSVGARFVDRLSRPGDIFGWVEFAIGFSAIGVIWGLGNLPMWIVPVVLKYRDSYNLMLFIQFLLVFLMIMAPTFLMGTAFPLAVKLISMGRAGVGKPVGIAYGWNTGGAIAGSFIGGFVLIPLLGLKGAIGFANIVNWVAGAALLMVGMRLWERKSSQLRSVVVVGLLAVGVIITVVMPRWNKRLMDTGPFLYADFFRSRGESQLIKEYWDMIGEQVFYDEGVTTTVSVRRGGGGDLFLRINGKTDASSGGDMSTQVLSGHLPLLFQQSPKDVLVIGLASGITTGAVTRYSSVERVDIVEISEGVIKACKKFFPEYNHNVLKDPRVNLILGDGRNHLRETDRKYDAIISEPSNPWIAGISSLFTLEFFKTGRDHLKPGGAMLIWVQGYSMNPESFRAVVRTFSEVFPEMYLWDMGIFTGTDFGLLGFVGQGKHLNCASLKRHLSEPAVLEDLHRVEADSISRIISLLMIEPGEIAAFAKRGRIHTDDAIFLEYEAPRALHQPTAAGNMKSLLAVSITPIVSLSGDCMDMQERLDTLRLIRARKEFQQGIVDRGKGTEFDRERMITRLEAAYKLDPASSRYRNGLRNEVIQRAGDNQFVRNWAGAALDYKRLIGWFPKDGELYFLFGVALNNVGSTANLNLARDAFVKAESLGYRDASLYYGMATIDYQAATENPTETEATRQLLEKAALNYRHALDLKPAYVEAWNGYGLTLLGLGRFQESKAALEEALKQDPARADTYLSLATLALDGFNNAADALAYLNKALSLAGSPEQRKEIENMILTITGKEGR